MFRLKYSKYSFKIWGKTSDLSWRNCPEQLSISLPRLCEKVFRKAHSLPSENFKESFQRMFKISTSICSIVASYYCRHRFYSSITRDFCSGERECTTTQNSGSSKNPFIDLWVITWSDLILLLFLCQVHHWESQRYKIGAAGRIRWLLKTQESSFKIPESMMTAHFLSRHVNRRRIRFIHRNSSLSIRRYDFQAIFWLLYVKIKLYCVAYSTEYSFWITNDCAHPIKLASFFLVCAKALKEQSKRTQDSLAEGITTSKCSQSCINMGSSSFVHKRK